MFGIASLGGGTSFATNDLLIDLQQIGRAAQPAPANWFPGTNGSPSVVITGSPIAGACTQLGSAWMGPRQAGGSFRVGGVAMAQRTALPIETHYLVYPSPSWAANAAPIEIFGARLDQKTKGLFNPTRAALSWIGGPFAQLLGANTQLHEVLYKHLFLDDRVDIRPQSAARLVRIVHKRIRMVESTLFEIEPSELRAVEPPLFWAFEQIAWMIHAWASPTAS